jgi:hypothetical protein
VICTFVDDEGNPFVPPTAQFTKLQVFMAIKVAIATGLPAAQSTAWFKHQAGEVIPPHLAHEVTPASNKLGARMSSWKKIYLNREAETIMDMLQDEENTRAELAGDISKAKDVRKAAKAKAAQEKKDKENQEKDFQVFGSECAVDAIRRLSKVEDGRDCDLTGAIAAFRQALVCLNVPDPTLDPDNKDNQ